jgi:hypothetical protein
METRVEYVCPHCGRCVSAPSDQVEVEYNAQYDVFTCYTNCYECFEYVMIYVSQEDARDLFVNKTFIQYCDVG